MQLSFVLLILSIEIKRLWGVCVFLSGLFSEKTVNGFLEKMFCHENIEIKIDVLSKYEILPKV